MNLYPETAADKLGFEQVLAAVQNYCLTEEGRAFAGRLKPMPTQAQIETRLKQTVEFKDLLVFDQPLPISYLPPVQHSLAKAEIPGNYLVEEEFYKLLQWLRTVRQVHLYFHDRREKYVELAKLLNISKFDTSFSKAIESILTPDGHLSSNASPELARLRRTIAERTAFLRQQMDKLLRHIRSNGWTDSPECTIRNERLVIPMATDFKGKVDGLIHDVSGSGQTIYIEPLEVVALNNEARELRLRERNEIIRILTALTDQMRPLLPEFLLFLKFVTFIDVIRAKAKLAIDLDATAPKIDAKNKRLEILNGRHPLLLLQKGREKVVPLNLSLDGEKRIMLISGPNAGGKSVALKTVGLLQLMLQSGLLIPADDNSTFPIVQRLFIDIGDDQSIQNDLSTYTSHLSHMGAFLKGLNAKSLFLIDEFGAGTDPMMGGPMAEALLEQFVRKNSYGVITTHYSNLKDFGAANQNTVNAAMRFDLANITPTYSLQQGLPGSSYAFEIAARAGIAAEIINSAKQKVGTLRTDIETLLKSLKLKEEETETAAAALRKKQTELDELIAKNKAVQRELEQKKKKLAQELKETSAYVIHDANKKIEAAVREIKEAQAEKERTKKIREELKAALKKPVETPEEPDPEVLPYEEQPDEAINAGDWVKLPDSDTVVKVLEIKDKKAVVALGEMQTALKLKDLMKVKPRETASANTSLHFAYRRSEAAHRKIDIRGLRLDEAMPLLEKFVDDALLAGMPEILIVHGKGGGSLRQGVRLYLQKHYVQIKGMYDAPENEGGTGITICVLE